MREGGTLKVSVRAVLEGALIGLGVAFVLALAVAILDYQFALTSRIETIFIWLGAAVTALTAGWAAGRLADVAGWFHGTLAAITLNLVATVIGETLHANPGSHLWTGLGMAALAGLVGGMIGAYHR
ncbi:MAG: TIGR04086 family membrane protein [Firmicutes bacterium]|nr:TIGR04086 family membrane protein [Bacillota bacterium]